MKKIYAIITQSSLFECFQIFVIAETSLKIYRLPYENLESEFVRRKIIIT